MSDTFPDETLYPVLTSLADNDRIFASNSAAGHESSQIKGSTIKKTNTYTFHNGGEVTGVPWGIHGCNGTAVLTLPAGVPIGTEIGVFAGVTVVSTVTITRAGSDMIYTPSGSASSFSVTGFGRYFTVVKTTSSSWNICGLEDSAIAASLAGKAPLASPALTGTPTAPTAAAGTNTTQLATTAFVTGALASKANDADVVKLTGNQIIGGTKTFTASPVLPTPTAGDNTTKGATTAFVQAQKASPELTGTPTAPTAAVGTNTTQIATTAFCGNYNQKWTYSYAGVGGAISASAWTMHAFAASGTLTLPLASSVASGVHVAAIVVAGGVEVVLTRSGSDQFVTPTGLATTYTLKGNGSSIVLVRATASAWACVGAPDSLIAAAIAAAKVSPALTGTPTAPTAATGTTTTQLATTAFCAAGFLPRFEAVVETGTNVTSPSVGTLYVNTLPHGDGTTYGAASLACTLPSPTGNGGKVIGFTCKNGAYDSWVGWMWDEANWSIQGHIDGVANNTTFTQISTRPSGVIFWCNGTTWMRVSMWNAPDEHVY